jgi:hypothetical protein
MRGGEAGGPVARSAIFGLLIALFRHSILGGRLVLLGPSASRSLVVKGLF